MPEASGSAIANEDSCDAPEQGENRQQHRPGGGVAALCIAQITARWLTIVSQEPLLPGGGRWLKELVPELGQQVLVLNWEVFDT